MTAQPKWTPGPWSVVESNAAPRWWIVQNPETWVDRVAAVPAYARHADGTACNTEANAHLIAAAPDLYAALDAAMAFIDSHAADPDITAEMRRNYQALNDLRPHAALAKARGEA